MAFEPVPKAKRLETVAVLAGVCLVIVAVKHHRLGIPAREDVGLYTALILLGIGVFIPPLGEWITRGWFGLSHVLGAVVGRVVLGIVFVLVLTPLAFVRRIFEKDHLKLEREHGDRATYFVAVDKEFAPKDLKHPW